jgi:hypothetical protein
VLSEQGLQMGLHLDELLINMLLLTDKRRIHLQSASVRT